MKRPQIIHFIAIQTREGLHVKTSLTLSSTRQYPTLLQSLAQDFTRDDKDKPLGASFPIQAFRMLKGQSFSIKVSGIDHQDNILFKKVFESDRVGSFNFKIPFDDPEQTLKALNIYEVAERPGLELHLGSYIPLKITDPKKIVICDFDKTLVDTKYSTTKELYTSLTQPIDYFPTVPNSVDILKGHIQKGYHPFILSASPHFYEQAMRDWLYQNHIYTAGIFLKDYRHIFNLLELDLTPKDLKVQGMYKLNHLLDIILMVGIPDELVLMGDNFESDPIIYLALSSLLKSDIDPWKFINFLDGLDSFQMNKKQKAHLLSKSYQISSKIGRIEQSKNIQRFNPNLQIFIRKKVKEDQIKVPSLLEKNIDLIQLYEGLSPQLISSPGEKSTI